MLSRTTASDERCLGSKLSEPGELLRGNQPLARRRGRQRNLHGRSTRWFCTKRLAKLSILDYRRWQRSPCSAVSGRLEHALCCVGRSKVLGLEFKETIDDFQWTKGCYALSGGVRFNQDVNGSKNSQARQICKQRGKGLSSFPTSIPLVV